MSEHKTEEAVSGTPCPKRIQRQRTKGWRMPEGAIYVGRPTRWGNPFGGRGREPEAGEATMTREYLVEDFRRWLEHPHGTRRMGGPGGGLVCWCLRYGDRDALLRDVRDALAGHDLACWCPLDQPCHADVLLEVANRG